MKTKDAQIKKYIKALRNDPEGKKVYAALYLKGYHAGFKKARMTPVEVNTLHVPLDEGVEQKSFVDRILGR